MGRSVFYDFGQVCFEIRHLSALKLGPSGGPFLVPPRKGERMRLKGGASYRFSCRSKKTAAGGTQPKYGQGFRLKNTFLQSAKGVRRFAWPPCDRDMFQRFTASMNFKNAVLPHSVRLYTPASSRTWEKTLPVSRRRISRALSGVKVYRVFSASTQSACLA